MGTGKYSTGVREVGALNGNAAVTFSEDAAPCGEKELSARSVGREGTIPSEEEESRDCFEAEEWNIGLRTDLLLK